MNSERPAVLGDSCGAADRRRTVRKPRIAAPRQLNANPAVEVLLQPFRSYAGFFGGATMPPASALLDNDPINIGDDWSRVWRWKNEDGTAINVTGYTGTFELFDGETSVHSGARDGERCRQR